MKKGIINVVVYLRVSTDEQATQGFSLDYQHESIKKFCEIKGYNIIKVFREDHSAKNFNRPEWVKLHTYVKANKKDIQMLLFVKWDRFSRNVEKAFAVLSDYEQMGVEVNATEQWLDMTNPDNRMILAMYLTLGEVERHKISSRTMDGTHQAKKEGYFTGLAPYGYRNIRDFNKKSTLEFSNDAHLMTRAFKEIALGVESIEAIRKRLQKHGLNLTKQPFYRALKNVTYTGKIYVPEYKKESSFIVEGKHPAIIDIETFSKVQAIRDGKRWKGIVPSNKNISFPLRGFLECDVCGNKLTGSASSGRSKKYNYYHCCNGCPTRVSLKKVHDEVAKILADLQIHPNIQQLYKEILLDVANKSVEDGIKQQKKKVIERSDLQKKIEETEDRLVNKDISIDTFNSITERYKGRIREINSDLEEISYGTKNNDLKYCVEAGLKMLSNLHDLFMNADYDGKRVIVGSLFPESIIIGNNGCRTTELNKVLELLNRKPNSYEEKEEGKTVKNNGLSLPVPGAGLEPAQP